MGLIPGQRYLLRMDPEGMGRQDEMSYCVLFQQ
jgi:hypothetical protein